MSSNQIFRYESCAAASHAGDLDTLKRMHLAGYRWSLMTPAYAAARNRLDCLKYAHSQGCEWNEWTPLYAGSRGNLECLRYAIENDCPWNEETPRNVTSGGHFECFKYCFEKWSDPQTFWNIDFESGLSNMIEQIDLDDLVWRRLFNLDLNKYPDLQSKVEAKKKEIEDVKSGTKESLENSLAMDIIQYCLHPFI
jgi:hypothetical protein